MELTFDGLSMVLQFMLMFMFVGFGIIIAFVYSETRALRNAISIIVGLQPKLQKEIDTFVNKSRNNKEVKDGNIQQEDRGA